MTPAQRRQCVLSKAAAFNYRENDDFEMRAASCSLIPSEEDEDGEGSVIDDY